MDKFMTMWNPICKTKIHHPLTKMVKGEAKGETRGKISNRDLACWKGQYKLLSCALSEQVNDSRKLHVMQSKSTPTNLRCAQLSALPTVAYNLHTPLRKALCSLQVQITILHRITVIVFSKHSLLEWASSRSTHDTEKVWNRLMSE